MKVVLGQDVLLKQTRERARDVLLKEMLQRVHDVWKEFKQRHPDVPMTGVPNEPAECQSEGNKACLRIDQRKALVGSTAQQEPRHT